MFHLDNVEIDYLEKIPAGAHIFHT
jgi:hypothetical protein